MKKNLIIQCMLLLLICMMPRCSSQTPAFDSDRAFAYLEIQCNFGPRNPGSKGYLMCLDYFIKELNKYADKVQKQPFHALVPGTSQTLTFTNIIASFGTQSQRILLCAHWDTRARADEDPDPKNQNTPILGANDGASGVAVLLEIARILHQTPAPIGVDLVFFDAEDAGLGGQWETWCLGSRHFAQSDWLSTQPQYAILLDMVGDRDLSCPIEYHSNQYAPQIVNHIWSRAESLGLDIFQQSDGPAVIDDHLNLLRAGIPAVDIIDFDYKYWHTIEDTPDKCSPESLGAVGTLLIHLIYEPK